MKKDKIRLYVLQLVLILLLSITLFSNILLPNKKIIALFLLMYMFIVKRKIGSISNTSIHKKEVNKYMFLFALLYLIIYYVIGYYVGYYKATYRFGLWTIINQILPIVLIIVSSEVLRSKFISDKDRISLIMTYIFGILIDFVIYANIYDLTNLSGFLEALGYVFFASIASNLLYNYVSYNFGIIPNIIYRIIITIYLYIIPITPDVHIYFKSFARIVYPILIYITLANSYEKKNKALAIRSKKTNNILMAITLVLVLLFTMLISCKFKYGLIVVGSSSMKEAMEKGDAILFNTKVNIDKLKEGKVILFKKDDKIIIHRLISIDKINNEYRLYTKGDNNSDIDEGYVTKDNLYGVAELKIRKIGLPTLWIHEIFN